MKYTLPTNQRQLKHFLFNFKFTCGSSLCSEKNSVTTPAKRSLYFKFLGLFFAYWIAFQHKYMCLYVYDTLWNLHNSKYDKNYAAIRRWDFQSLTVFMRNLSTVQAVSRLKGRRLDWWLKTLHTCCTFSCKSRRLQSKNGWEKGKVSFREV